MAADQSHTWLPAVKTTMRKPITVRYIKNNKDDDPFLWLANAIADNRGDEVHARMLARTHYFLQDHDIPGFTGRFGHIRGDEVMTSVLYGFANNTDYSRHPVTRKADAALTKLGTWMEKGKTWQGALERAKHEAEMSHRKSWKIPVLFTPEQLLAGCVIAHPDSKFKDRVESLQIQWMLFPDVPVTEGYWQGIGQKDLNTCFEPLETPQSQPELYLDYHTILGDAYAACCRDISPFLPPWARKTEESWSSPAASPRKSTGPTDGIIVRTESISGAGQQHPTPAQPAPQSPTPAAQPTTDGFANRKSTKRPAISQDSSRPSKIVKLDDAFKDDLVSMFNNLAADLKKASEAQLANIVERLDLQTTKTQEQLTSLINRIQALEAGIEKFPRPGTEGYLAIKCPPPANWTETREAWLGMLHRAAMLYIFEWGRETIPAMGVEKDSDVCKVVRKSFPELSEGDVMYALKHVHIQAFGHPLPD